MSWNPAILTLIAKGKPIHIKKHNEVVQKIGDLFDKTGALRPSVLLNLHQLLFPGSSTLVAEPADKHKPNNPHKDSKESSNALQPHTHHPHNLRHAALFPPTASLDAENTYLEFQKNNFAIQRLSHFNEPIQKEIVKILSNRNQALATSFLERFSPTRNQEALKELVAKIKDPKLVTALSDHSKKSDRLYNLHHDEMGAFLRSLEKKNIFTAAVKHPTQKVGTEKEPKISPEEPSKTSPTHSPSTNAPPRKPKGGSS